MSSSPCFTPRAMIPSASNGSNIFGKMVTKSIFNGIEIVQPFRQLHHHALPVQVDLGAELGREGQLELAPVGPLHAEKHAATALVHVGDDAAFPSLRIDEGQADQVVQKVLVLF